MKSSLYLFLLTIVLGACQAQQKTVEITDPILLQAKETSLYTDKVDWPIVNQRYLELTEGKETVEELKPGLEYLLNSLGDKHGTFRAAKDFSIVAYYTGEIHTPDTRDPDFVNTVINDPSARFSYELLGDGIGYLRVVGIGGNATVKENADIIRKGIIALSGQQVDKWILDLRYNGGGNMNPMIAGLAPLLGEGFIGGSLDANDAMVQEYQITEGQFFDTGRLVCEMENEPKIKPEEKVAILVSKYTISSGELVAVAFKGRENTLFIGEASAGYTTGNGYNQVREDLFMMISQSIYMDRDKNKYEGKVPVDVPMEFHPTEQKLEDPHIIKAIEWLNE